MMTDMGNIRPPGVISVYDSTLTIWEEPGGHCGLPEEYEGGFMRDVFAPLIRYLRSIGWSVRRNEDVHRRYPTLTRWHRYCHRGDLEAKLELSGRTVKFEMYQNIANVENRNGGQYDFDKMARMPYLLRKRAEFAIAKLTAYLVHAHGYAVKPREMKCGPGGLTARQWIDQNWRLHRFRGDKPLSDDEIQDCNKSGADGSALRNGQCVYFPDEKGRWLVGVAEHHINNMWWVVAGPYAVRNVASFDLRTLAPDDLRRKDNCRLRRRRLEQELARACDRMDFRRAETLKNILYGDRPVYRIYSRKHGLYYSCDCRGYANNRNDAGKYSYDEAMRHVDRSGLELLLEPVTGDEA